MRLIQQLVIMAVLAISLVGCKSPTSPENPILPCRVGIHNFSVPTVTRVTIDGTVVTRNVLYDTKSVAEGYYLTGSHHTFALFTSDTVTSAFHGTFDVPWTTRYICNGVTVAVVVDCYLPGNVVVKE